MHRFEEHPNFLNQFHEMREAACPELEEAAAAEREERARKEEESRAGQRRIELRQTYAGEAGRILGLGRNLAELARVRGVEADLVDGEWTGWSLLSPVYGEHSCANCPDCLGVAPLLREGIALRKAYRGGFVRYYTSHGYNPRKYITDIRTAVELVDATECSGISLELLEKRLAEFAFRSSLISPRH